MIKNVYKILTIKQKRNFSVLAFLALISSILELLGIGLVYPLLLVISDPSIQNNQYYTYFQSEYKLLHKEIILLISISIVFVFFFKNIFVFIVKSLIENFQKNFRIDVLKKITYKLFYFPFERSFKITTDEQLKKINFCLEYSQVYKIFLNLIIEIITLTLIVFYLSYLNLKISIFLFFFFPFVSFIIFKISKKKIEYFGNQSIKLFKNLVERILQSIGGIKEIRIAKKEDEFENLLNNINVKDSQNRFKNNLYLLLPSHLIEILSVLFLCFSIFLMLFVLEVPSNNVIATIAVFAVSFARLMPSTTRIIAYLQILKYNLPLTKIISNELLDVQKFKKNNKTKNFSEKIKFDKFIKFRNISFYFQKNNKIIKNLNILILKNQIFGVTGKSGKGKTTLINLLLGLYEPKNGNIFIDDNKLSIKNCYDWQKKIGFVSQKPFFLNDTIENNINFLDINKKSNDKKIINSLKTVKLFDEIKKFPNYLNYKIGENGNKLSGGQLQRLAIARALYKNPEILILDEATSSLDKKNEEQILKILKNLKKKITIILISHQKSNLKICDKIYQFK